nr:DUF6500 family protein [uncultured Algibacter sp.]
MRNKKIVGKGENIGFFYASFKNKNDTP